MNSAYKVLGVPGNATAADIEEAYARAQSAYSHQRMAEDSRVAEQMAEVRNAYKVLRDPDARLAHDRKLAQQRTSPVPRRTPRSETTDADETGLSKPVKLAALLTVALFVGGFYVQQRRQATEAAIASQTLEAARLQAATEAEAQKIKALEASERARRDAQNNASEQAFRHESEAARVRLQYQQAQQAAISAQQQAIEAREQQRRDYERKMEEQRRIAESQRRLAADKQHLRELCYINYRRYDC